MKLISMSDLWWLWEKNTKISAAAGNCSWIAAAKSSYGTLLVRQLVLLGSFTVHTHISITGASVTDIKSENYSQINPANKVPEHYYLVYCLYCTRNHGTNLRCCYGVTRKQEYIRKDMTSFNVKRLIHVSLFIKWMYIGSRVFLVNNTKIRRPIRNRKY